MQKKAVPFGSWSSPVTTDLVLAESISLSEVAVLPSKTLVWLEGRPGERGRNALVSSRDGKAVEVIPDQKWNARSRVHEYGGASFTLAGENVVFSSIDGPLFEVKQLSTGAWSSPAQISPKSDVYRYADFAPHPSDPSLLVSVLEDHTIDVPADVVNSLVLLSSQTASIHPVASGKDFYAAPRWSLSGKLLSWISWVHPDMPWEGSELWVAEVGFKADGSVDVDAVVVPGSAKKLAGVAAGVESVSQPRWSLKDGKDLLVFLSDRTGFYELYQWSEGGQVELILKTPGGSDIGSPDWIFGQRTHAALTSTRWIAKGPSGTLSLIDLPSKSSRTISTPYASITSLTVLSPTSLLVLGSPAAKPSVLAILTLDAESGTITHEEIVKSSSSASVDADYISTGEKIAFPTKGKEGQEAYGIWYAPTHKRNVGLENELPPAVIHCHGGPTSAAGAGLDWLVQFFTSRGFAYVEVNYGGSSGFGREYRKRLDKSWGVVDVQDTIACVEHLVKEKKIDAKRVAITGGSAGGFTVLAALCAGDVFSAGTSSYGISDLLLLAGDTHKFESQYLFNLLGGAPSQVPSVYHDRSPINHASSITSPLLILQGDQDRVVPPAQATKMAEEIKAAGGEAELVVFVGEGHGFRRADSKKVAMERELGWYRRWFGIGEEESE